MPQNHLRPTTLKSSYDKSLVTDFGNLAEKKNKNFRYGVLDLETRRSAKEVGGWNRANDMGVSCVVVYDSHDDEFKEYLQEDVPDLVKGSCRF